MKFNVVFFDLDDTLYPAQVGLWSAIKERMNLYMRERLGIPEAEIPRLRETYFQTYGTTLRGLQKHHRVDTQDFLAFVHHLPLADYLRPDENQRAILQALPVRKIIFTNADVPHAQRVLTALNLLDLFDAIVDVNALAPYCKPLPESFTIALKLAGESDPARCAMIDDLPRATRAAKQAGMFSALYGAAHQPEDADAHFTDWRDLPRILEQNHGNG